MRMQLYIGPLCPRASQARTGLKAWNYYQTGHNLLHSCAWPASAAESVIVCDSMGWEEDSIWAWIFEYRTVILPMLMSVSSKYLTLHSQEFAEEWKAKFMRCRINWSRKKKSAKSASLMKLSKRKKICEANTNVHKAMGAVLIVLNNVFPGASHLNVLNLKMEIWPKPSFHVLRSSLPSRQGPHYVFTWSLHFGSETWHQGTSCSDPVRILSLQSSNAVPRKCPKDQEMP